MSHLSKQGLLGQSNSTARPVEYHRQPIDRKSRKTRRHLKKKVIVRTNEVKKEAVPAQKNEDATNDINNLIKSWSVITTVILEAPVRCIIHILWYGSY